MAQTATYLRDIVGWTGDVRVYELSEPLCGYSFVIVSATYAFHSGPETYIFGATAESLEKDDVADWCELYGSFRGGLDHAKALRSAGYEVSK